MSIAGTVIGNKLAAQAVRSSGTGNPSVVQLGPKDSASKPSPLLEAVNNFASNWDKAHQDFQVKLRSIAPQYRTFVDVQCKVQDLNLQTHLATQVVESVNSSLKRLQQAGQG